MSITPKFEIRFDPGAYREYEKLDGSIVGFVDQKLEELEYRADEIGKVLSNIQNTKLAGCREIKLRDAGIRIVYRITSANVDILRIVYILAIEKRAGDYVFKLADQRLSSMRQKSSEPLNRQIQKSTVYKRNKN